MTAAKPQSPCISICTLDEHDLCMGCYRSLDEIVDWTMMTDDEKRAVLANVAERSAQQKQAV
ncbi:MAG: DUF1289 domain-containing protein [Pseudomonadota bacterium]